MSNKLEQFEFKLEKIIGIEKHAGKVRKLFIISFSKQAVNYSILFENSVGNHLKDVGTFLQFFDTLLFPHVSISFFKFYFKEPFCKLGTTFMDGIMYIEMIFF